MAASSQCTIDLSNNFPYDTDTFGLVRSLASCIKTCSSKFGVPAIAVAGSIADEFNTRRGPRAAIDWVQDVAVISKLPNCLIVIDAYLGIPSKLLNATRNDLGPGNINLATAMEIYRRNVSSFPKWVTDWADLADFLLTDQGTVLVASLVIKKGMSDMALLLTGRTKAIQEAILVTYYKQGPAYVGRFMSRLKTDPAAELTPGEGCRVFHQRATFSAALSVN